MVAQRNKGIRMRSRATRGKENILSSLRLRHKEETYLRKLELGISVFRNKIQSRVDRCQEVLQRLDHDSKQMQICFLQLMEMVENSRKLISDEKEENLQLLQLLDCYSDKTRVSSKTQTVSPMIYGIPLKKASISLKRLDPFREQHNHNISRVIADSSPASAVGFSRTITHTPLRQSIEALEVTSSSSSLSDDEDPDIALARYRTNKKWNKVTHHVTSTSGQEIRLKRASIQLERLDPRSYVPYAGNTESLSSNNMTFRRSDIESDVFESLYRTAVEANAEDESTRTEPTCVSSGLSYIPCRIARPDPMVVLKRLGPFSHSGESDCHDQNTCSPSASSDHEIENYQSNNKLKIVSERSQTKHENKKNSQQSADSVSTCKKRKSENIMSVGPEKQRVHCKVNAGKKPVKESANSNADVQRKKAETIRKRKEKEITVAVSAANKMDEDPLEGPSWLYKDGVKKEKLKKLRRIRQGYLTPLYYLAPTIYSSTDDSGDEMTANERKNSKLRKKKQRKRN